MRVLIAYLATLAAMLALDFTWLSAMGGFYHRQFGPLLLAKPDWAPGIAFYLLYVAGVTGFVVAPTLRGGAWRRATTMGGAFGLVAYATYDLTNLATLKGFSLTLCLTDMAWGVVITAASATAGYVAARKWG